VPESDADGVMLATTALAALALKAASLWVPDGFTDSTAPFVQRPPASSKNLSFASERPARRDAEEGRSPERLRIVHEEAHSRKTRRVDCEAVVNL
jgi:hypothetical protein